MNRGPAFADLDERVFRAYARHLAGDHGHKQNTVQTYYAYVSAWCEQCVNEGYPEAHYAQRTSVTAPLPEDDGRKPSDQQAWSPEHRHALTRHVDEVARNAIEQFTTAPTDSDPLERERARYTALRTARDRALIFVIAYTAVRVGEFLQDPSDPRRRDVRWGEIEWDSASLPDPVIPALRIYKRLMKPPANRQLVFPTFDQRTLAGLVGEELATGG